MPVQTAVLLGKDHTELGAIHVETLGVEIALGISTGRFPKAYPHTCPNEDAAFAATDGTTHLIVVADGHNGGDAAEAVILRLVGRADELLATDPREAVAMARDLCIEATSDLASGTTVAFALISPDRTDIFSAGDSPILDLTRRPKWLTRPTPFLPHADPSRPHATPRTDHLLALTDGIIDFVGRRPAGAIAAVAKDEPARSAASIVELAHAGAAGDNTTVAVFRRSPHRDASARMSRARVSLAQEADGVADKDAPS